MLNRGVTPVVPCQGSVGASGDLAPLAHMTLALIGEGEAFYRGERLPSADALRARRACADRARREGRPRADQRHAGDDGHRRARRAARGAARGRGRRDRRDVAGGVSRHRARLRPPPERAAPAPGPGARRREPARAARGLGDRGSRTPTATASKTRTRSAASRSCTARCAIRSRTCAASPRSRRTRSPTIRSSFPRTASFISGGNFHGEPVALVIDFLKMAISELASIAERRLYLLLNAEDRGLPLFLDRALAACSRG